MPKLIRVGLLPFYAPTVELLGKDPNRVCQQAGFDPEGLELSDAFIPYPTFRRLLSTAVVATGCERFGLRMARQLQAQSLGLVGLAMQQAPDVGAAFELLARYLHLHDQHGAISLYYETDHYCIEYYIPDPTKEGGPQAVDVAAALGRNLLKALAGRETRALRYEFPYPEPSDLTEYPWLDAESFSFGHDRLRIVVPGEVPKTAIVDYNPRLAELFREYMSTLESRSGSQLHEQVQRVVRDLLATAECSLRRVSEMFGVTSRTLQNRLQREDTSFHEIVEDTRRELSCHYLTTTRLELTTIAQLLGYSDSSSFTRSFRRWFGTTPSAWRQKSI
ncbi:MAG: AraC family transcriptional regulator [Halioglobus sp.]|jgi:AraC-like DNA-binding protein